AHTTGHEETIADPAATCRVLRAGGRRPADAGRGGGLAPPRAAERRELAALVRPAARMVRGVVRGGAAGVPRRVSLRPTGERSGGKAVRRREGAGQGRRRVDAAGRVVPGGAAGVD